MTSTTLLNLADVSHALRLPERSVRYLIRKGDLAAITLPGGQLRVEPAALDAFIERCRK